ncbi:MAG TPA: hypothetical protein VIK01_12570 [Polyangiaceae bacterium]
MKRTPARRALTFLGSTFLLLAGFEACSSNDSSTLPVSGPPGISITKISFGPSTELAQGGASSEPACGKQVAVTLNINNWLLKEPGLCQSTPQCGQVQVSLFKDTDSNALATKVAVSAAVDLTVPGSLEAGSYKIEAELIDDDGKVFTVTDAGSSSAQESFQVNPVVDCPSSAAGGAPGSGGSSSSDAGAAGFGGAAPDLGTAGSDGIVAGAGGS